MDSQEQKFELIISAESKVLSCNITDFEKQAEQFLSTLTATFETDDDFAAAKEEVKQLKELEDRTRQAIDNVLNGNKDVAELITAAEAIAERFREARLSRDKLVKTKEAEVKQHVADEAIAEIMDTRNNACSESATSLALESTMPKNKISQRIQEATKNKRTIDGLKKAVNAEKMLILAEITQEIARLQSRLKLIPLGSSYLFSDSVKLIAGTDELEPIVAERIEAEKQREAELKAKAEQEALTKAQAQQAAAEKAKREAEERAKTQAQAATVAETQKSQLTPTESVENFVITIRLNNTTRTQATDTAQSLKTRFGDCVSLNKAK